MMACGNIIKEDQEFGTVESQKSPLLLFPVVCPLFASMAMVIFSKNNKNTEKKSMGKLFARR